MKPAKVLIVEDEAIIAMSLRKTVQDLGYSVCGVVASGEEAVKKEAETLPDLVLMDILLRGQMDGIEAAQRMRDRYEVPVLFLSATLDEETRQRVSKTKSLGCLPKPIEQRVLENFITQALH